MALLILMLSFQVLEAVSSASSSQAATCAICRPASSEQGLLLQGMQEVEACKNCISNIVNLRVSDRLEH